MLELEFKYYIEHQDELVQKYNGKYLVIKGEQIAGAYDTKVEAYTETSKKYETGSFLIQRCSPGNKDYTQTFYSRVSFS
jgi:hypothetical protein